MFAVYFIISLYLTRLENSTPFALYTFFVLLYKSQIGNHCE